MSFSNFIDNDFRVPANADLGVPGIRLTTEVPAVLLAAYSDMVAVQIEYTTDNNTYWFTGLTSGFMVRGVVLDDAVREFVRSDYVDGAPPTLRERYRDGIQLLGELNSIFQWEGLFSVDGTASFNGPLTLSGTVDVNGAANFFAPATFFSGTVRSSNLSLLRGQKGIEFVTVPNGASSATLNVTFPVAFPTGVTPHVTANILSGAGITSRWVERCVSVTNTGFSIFLFSGNAATTTGFSTDVSWSAVEEIH